MTDEKKAKMIAKVDERIEVYISVIGPLETLFNSIRRMVTIKKELAVLEGELSTLQQNKGAMIAAAAAAATAVEEQEQRETATTATTATTVGPNSRSRRNRKTRRRN